MGVPGRDVYKYRQLGTRWSATSCILEQENKENDVRINTIDGVNKTIVISVNKQGTNVVLMPVFKGQKSRLPLILRLKADY